MKIFFEKGPLNKKVINWCYIHRKILKLQSQIVKNLKKKNFRKVRYLQRLLLKSFSSHLLISQKLFGMRNKQKFNDYVFNRKSPFLNLLNLNNFLQIEKHYLFELNQNYYSLTYFQFLSLLWVLALIPINETFSNLFSYNYRLYRNQTDILNEINSMFNFTDYKWLLILRPSSFFGNKNKKWILKNTFIEKKFLFYIFKLKKVAKYSDKYYNDKEHIELKKISLIKLIKSACFYNILKKKNINPKIRNFKMSLPNSIIYYNDLILIPSTHLNSLNVQYTDVFIALHKRGLIISKKRIWIINLMDGFNFLGWFIKKEKSRIIVKISSRNIKLHQFDIKKFLKSSKFLPLDKVILELNKKILTWQLYCAYASNLPQTWSEMNYYLFCRIWRWCKKKHKNKGSKWLYLRYWFQKENKKWVFHYNNQYLNSYTIKKQMIIPLPATINVCESKNWKKTYNIVLKKYKNFDINQHLKT